MKYAAYATLTILVVTVLFSSIVSGFSLAIEPNTTFSTPASQGLQVWFNGTPQLTTAYPTFYEFNVAAKTSSGLWITTLHWDFGDGSTLDVPFSAQNEVSDVRYHTYSQPGRYTVSVTAHDNMGNSGSAQEQVSWPDPVLLPYAGGGCGSPTVTLFSPEVNGLSVTVNGVTLPGSSSCSMTSISWSWGDGSTSTSWFPATHTYSAAGPYTITVTTHQSDGTTAYASTSVNLTGQQGQASCGAPTITLQTPGISNLMVSVNGETLPGSSSCSITSISWTWGDGSSSTSWFPAVHTYIASNTYSITATTHQSDGQTSTASTTVTIGPAQPSSCGSPTISLGVPSVNGLSVTVNGITLPGGSACSITSISWSWGDGSPSSSSWFPATHAYSGAASYPITATIYQSDGKTASASISVSVSPGSTTMTGNLQVLVEDEATSNPIAEASVVMTAGPSGQSLLSCTTSTNGICVFQNVPVGTYTLSASATDYQSGTQSGTVSAGQTEQLTVELTKNVNYEFQLSVNQQPAPVTNGQSVSVIIGVTQLFGSPEPIEVYVDGSTLPTAVTSHLSIGSVEPGSTTTLTLYTSVNGPNTTPTGTYPISIIGSAAGGMVKPATVSLTVASGVASGYSVRISSGDGGSVTYSYVGASGTVASNQNYWLSNVPLNAQVYLTAIPDSQHTFQSWSTSGAVSLSSSSASTILTVTDNVGVTAIFSVKSPSTTTSVEISSGLGGSVSYSYGTTSGTASSTETQSVTVPSGTVITLTATPDARHAFQSWAFTGSVSYVGSTSSSITISIGGTGTVTANFAPGLIVSISASASGLEASQSVTFSASASGGSGGYLYMWKYETIGNNPVQGSMNTGSSNQFTYKPTIAGTYIFWVVVTDSSGDSNTSLSLEVIVTPASATISLSHLNFGVTSPVPLTNPFTSVADAVTYVQNVARSGQVTPPPGVTAANPLATVPFSVDVTNDGSTEATNVQVNVIFTYPLNFFACYVGYDLSIEGYCTAGERIGPFTQFQSTTVTVSQINPKQTVTAKGNFPIEYADILAYNLPPVIPATTIVFDPWFSVGGLTPSSEAAYATAEGLNTNAAYVSASQFVGGFNEVDLTVNGIAAAATDLFCKSLSLIPGGGPFASDFCSAISPFIPSTTTSSSAAVVGATLDRISVATNPEIIDTENFQGASEGFSDV